MKERVSDVASLVEALDKVNEGGSYVDAKVIDRRVDAKKSESSGMKWLTPREEEVLAKMVQGRDNATIGNTISINIRPVEKHINSIFAKLGLTGESGISKRVAIVLTYLQPTTGPSDGKTPTHVEAREGQSTEIGLSHAYQRTVGNTGADGPRLWGGST